MRLLAATSTLSAGVNLNVDIVVIDGIRRCNKFYTQTEYQQMIGRTGRMGQNRRGEVFVILEKNDISYFRQINTFQCLSPAHSEETKENVFLRSPEYWKKAILECVAIGIIKTIPDALNLFSQDSFYPHLNPSPVILPQQVVTLEALTNPSRFRLSIHENCSEVNSPLQYLLAKCIISLIDNHFLLLVLPYQEEMNPSEESVTLLKRASLSVTELGQAVFQSGMNVSEVHSLALALASLNQSIDISNSFQIFYHLTPITLNINVQLPVALDYIETNLSEPELQYVNRSILPLSTLYQLRSGSRIDVGIQNSNYP